MQGEIQPSTFQPTDGRGNLGQLGGSDPASNNPQPPQELSGMSGWLRTRFEECAAERLLAEQEWVRTLWQYLGRYDDTPSWDEAQRTQQQSSRAYIRLTRTKVRSTDARMMDILFPGGIDKNWAIDPTAEPTLPAAVMQQVHLKAAADALDKLNAGLESQSEDDRLALLVAGKPPPQVQQLFQALQQGQIPPELVLSPEDEDMAILAEAKRRAGRMSCLIDSQLDAGHYREEVRKVVHSGNLYGTGWLKGPLAEQHADTVWTHQPDPQGGPGAWVIEKNVTFRPSFSFVPVWDLYPDSLDVYAVAQMEGMFQRYVMTRAQVRKLGRRAGFNRGAIEDYLTSHPNGDSKNFRFFENELRLLKKEDRGTLNQGRQRRYEVLEWTGYVDGAWLQRVGVELPDEVLPEDDSQPQPEPEGQDAPQGAPIQPSGSSDGQDARRPPQDPEVEELAGDEQPDGPVAEYKANIWLLGNEVIKASLMPYDDDTIDVYHRYVFEESDTGILGIGIPEIMRDPQRMFNAAIRAMLDNMGLSSGPMYDVNVDLLEPSELANVEDIHPRRVWLRKGFGQDATSPAIRAIQVDSRVNEFKTVAELSLDLADEATSLPRYVTGNEQVQGAGQTAHGLSMLMGQANLALKEPVANFDDGITKPFIRGLYHWNMQFATDDDVKGDFEVSARASNSLVVKEIQSRNLDMFAATTANPLDDPWIKRGELNRERAKAHDLDPDKLVFSEKEHAHQVMQAQQAAAQAQAQQAQSQQDAAANANNAKKNQPPAQAGGAPPGAAPGSQSGTSPPGPPSISSNTSGNLVPLRAAQPLQ